MKFTELALTQGTWGRVPLSFEEQKKVITTYSRWADKNKISVRMECYSEHDDDRRALGSILEKESLVAVVRCEPRSDKLKTIAEMGIKHVVFDVPVSTETGLFRFLPDGVKRSPGYAAEIVRNACLLNLIPEIALVDITRAKPQDVLDVIDAVMDEARPRGIEPRWRLVDDMGLGNPLPRALPPRSMAGWIRFLNRKSGIQVKNISVQCSDQLGLGLANTLSGEKEGAEVVTSLLGLGSRSGWAATEVALFHLVDKELFNLKPLIKLKNVLDPDSERRDANRPVSGNRAWEFPAGTAPEEISKVKRAALVGFETEKITGIEPLPMLTSLSGHAGMLHLMHRFHPEQHFESDSPETMAVSAEFEDAFDAGRQQPVCWQELEPKLKKKKIL